MGLLGTLGLTHNLFGAYFCFMLFCLQLEFLISELFFSHVLNSISLIEGYLYEENTIFCDPHLMEINDYCTILMLPLFCVT